MHPSKATQHSRIHSHRKTTPIQDRSLTTPWLLEDRGGNCAAEADGQTNGATARWSPFRHRRTHEAVYSPPNAHTLFTLATKLNSGSGWANFGTRSL